MAVHDMPGPAPEAFQHAVATLRAARLRPEVVLTDVPGPRRIAAYSTALAADVVVGDEELATGRFVLLHEPGGQDAWEGTFRVVTFVRAGMDAEMGADPMLGQVGWTWFEESLARAGADMVAQGGTATRVLSESFAGLAERAPTVDLEVRASWTPVGDDLEPHLRGWADLLCTVAGLPPLPEGVTALPRRSR